ncbi:hypothetical protein LKI_09490 [Leuconostoc kimchii IMSNU 11154]|uniref:DUF4352 domain-containing protein n=1 Tax=Leuconostoc kimchii (strain IMSNU 11154 / KCTC 2386 / IH25) TaxID=762051 RepID=D5T4G6_LEUKI|nr:DUF4190 domain-containing protein [Leuconostoc kimchii]ADG41437.1 hypothetical protein LKI_09490 [Leuconostoc kimchii IMSNU 11154]
MERKVLGILSIVFGGFGLLLSWIPIINNFSFVLGILALILGIVALVVNRKNKKILAVIGTVISVVTIAIVLFTQAAYSHAMNKVSEDIKKSTSSSSEKTSKKDSKIYAINETVKHAGVEYKVNSVDFNEGSGFSKAENGEKYVVVNITITNKSKSDYDYNPLDFKLSMDGNEPDVTTIAPDDVDTFDSGTLKPDATLTGNLVVGKTNPNNTKELLLVHHDNNSIKDLDSTFEIKLK